MWARVAVGLRFDRPWQWAWDNYGATYSWAVFALACIVSVPLSAFAAVVAINVARSNHYLEAAAWGSAVTVVALYVIVRPGSRGWRLLELWASGRAVDLYDALASTYSYSRAVALRGAIAYGACGGVLGVGVSVIADASISLTLQLALIGATLFVALQAVAAHQFVEMWMRPCRMALTADSSVGDALPRSEPSFAAWSNLALIGVCYIFTLAGALIAVAIDRTAHTPALAVLIATLMTMAAVPLPMGTSFAPALRPIRDLTEGTERVANGDYSQRLPVVQDDDLGALTASFNRMQAGLAQREHLRAAFGSYVDPALAARLLDQSDARFAGERVDVTVMFVDIRDFTPFAESNTAEDTVAHLNALFDIVVPAVLDAGGHVNKYLGDGALAVFGAPNTLANHADAAVTAAQQIQRLVTDRFAGALRIGIGINTGVVIAGTIGGAGKLEFTLIGDAVNVAARVEQLTKTTGDTILVTDQTWGALTSPPSAAVDRGSHALKGKSAEVHLRAIA